MASSSPTDQSHQSLLDSLHEDLYLKILTTCNLSVGDIDRLRESGRDNRTELALAKQNPAIIRMCDYATNGEVREEDLPSIYAKLPKNLKSVNIFECISCRMKMKECEIKLLAKNCPNLEYLPSQYPDHLLLYINTIESESKLKKIYFRLFTSSNYDAISRVILSSHRLEALQITLTISAISKGLLDLIKQRLTLRKLFLLIDFTLKTRTIQKLKDLLTSLPLLEKLVLTPWMK